MTQTSERRAYNRETGRVVMPWLTAGFCVNAVGLTLPHAIRNHDVARPLGVSLLLFGATLICVSAWRGLNWRKAHPFRQAESPGKGAL